MKIEQMELEINKEFEKRDDDFIILENGNNDPFGCFFQDETMKSMFRAFPEILIIDSTLFHNKLQMSLYVFSIVDGNGRAEVVSLFPIGIKSDEMMTTFKSSNPSYESVKTILVDVEFLEIEALRKHFVNANVTAVPLNIGATFDRDVTTVELGITKQERKLCLSLLDILIKSKSEENYKRNRSALRSTGIENVLSYYKRWHKKKTEWVRKLKKGVHVYSNCLVETQRTFGKICSRRTSLAEFLTDLKLEVVRLRSRRDKKALLKFENDSTVRSYPEDSTKSKYARLLTPYAFSTFVHKQIVAQEKLKYVADSTVDSCVFLTKEGEKVSHVNWCDCTFRAVHGLPCAHILACRKNKKLDEFDPELVATRWLRSHYKSRHCAFKNNGSTATTNVREESLRQLVQEYRRQMATKVTSELAALVWKSSNEKQFRLKMEQLELLTKAWGE